MKILHFIPKGQEVRFFGATKSNLRDIFKDVVSVSDNKYVYNNYHDSTNFLSELNRRIVFPDISFITAHGGKTAILKKVNGRYDKEITINNVGLFKNNFVFAISCYTITVFGKSAIDNGAIAYLGFDDSIESFFRIDDTYKDLSIIFGTIIKQIYIRCITNEFEIFVKNCYTAKEFFLFLSLKVEKEMAKLHRMSISQINSEFNTKIPERFTPQLKMIKLELTQKAKILNDKMKLIGETNYIPWFYIQEQSEDKLMEILNKLNDLDEKNYMYKYFMEAIIYDKLGYVDKYIEALEKEQNESDKVRKPSFSSVLFAGEKVASSKEAN